MAKEKSGETKPDKKLKKDEYHEGIGRRKRATARVRIYSSTPLQSVEKKSFSVNSQGADKYFGEKYRNVAVSPLKILKLLDKFRLSVQVHGGGTNASAEAIRMGLARALVAIDPSFRKELKRAGYLTRDPREKERKKYGLKKARRAPQWRKR